MTLSPLPKDIIKMSFEDALKELEEIVSELESGQVKLDKAVSAYERGAQLRQHCENKLVLAKTKVEKISGTASDGLDTEEMDED